MIMEMWVASWTWTSLPISGTLIIFLHVEHEHGDLLGSKANRPMELRTLSKTLLIARFQTPYHGMPEPRVKLVGLSKML